VNFEPVNVYNYQISDIKFKLTIKGFG